MNIILNENNKKVKYVLNRGQLIIFPPKTPFFYSNASKVQTEYFWINFTGCEALNIINTVKIPLNAPYTVAKPRNIFEAFESFFNEFKHRAFLHEMSIFYKFLRIMILFGRAREDQVQKNSLTESLTYISNNYSIDITTEELAEMEHLSCAHYRRLFKEKIGMTPTQYISTIRLKHAEQMLFETELSIKEIAQKVGFSDQLYFSKVFSKHFGVSPKAFRNRSL